MEGVVQVRAMAIIAFAAAVLAGCGRPSLPTTVSFKSKKYDAPFVSILVPYKWTKRESETGAVSFLGKSEVPEGSYPPNVTIALTGVSSSASLVNCMQSALSGIKSQIGFRQFGTTDVSINGLPAKRVVAEFALEDRMVDVLLYFVKREDKFALVSCAASISQFHSYEPTFDQIAGSIQLK